MHVERLTLCNTRPYERKAFELFEGIHLFYGPNAKGKTTILEAVFVCAVGKSFRTSQLNDLIRRETAGFSIEAIYEKCGVQQEIKLCASPSEKYVLSNGSKQPLSSLYGGLTAVASIPEDIQLVKGPPALRREYLDQQLLQVDPLYNHHLKRYTKALKQRNSLLRAQSPETMHSWEYELAHSACYLIEVRQSVLEKLSTICADIYCFLSDAELRMALKYKPGIALPHKINSSDELREHLRQIWKTQRQRDMIVGTTLSGPHKDDFMMCLGELDLRHFGSEGEQRTAGVALRLAEWEQIYSRSDGEKPILLLDDIGYGLDALRQRRLVEWLHRVGQVFLTTTHPNDLISGNNVHTFAC